MYFTIFLILVFTLYEIYCPALTAVPTGLYKLMIYAGRCCRKHPAAKENVKQRGLCLLGEQVA